MRPIDKYWEEKGDKIVKKMAIEEAKTNNDAQTLKWLTRNHLSQVEDNEEDFDVLNTIDSSWAD